jgi:response regulator RpfG family c-di-GMP phosphodiesterase
MRIVPKFTFLLFCVENDEVDVLKKQISRNNSYNIESTKTIKAVYERVATGEVNCLIISLNFLDANTISVINKLRSYNQALAIVIVCNKVHREVVTFAKEGKRIVILERPYSERELTRICEKIVLGLEIFQRKTKRFPTNQPADVEKLNRHETAVCQVFNMSKGGAYIELEKGALSPGDVIKLNIHLDKLGKVHTLHAEVIWVVPHGFHQEKNGAGLKFMSVEEVYTSLLEKI